MGRKHIKALIVLTPVLILISAPPCGARVMSPMDIMVGVYYYPWHGPGAGGHSFDNTLRDHLVPKQMPALGHYNNADSAVIEDHIEQSLRGNIDFWACSWWGPGSYEDNVIRNNILPHASAGNLKYAILYESTGRLGSFSDPDYSNLVPDFGYLQENIFGSPHYLRIDGRPVVFIYLTRVYFRGQGDSALADLRSTFPELYIVADDVFGRYYRSSYAAKWDAVTAYDVYGQSLGSLGSTRAALSRLGLILSDARNAANSVGVGLVPFASPGFNDRGVRSGHTGAPRYFEDESISFEGDLFRTMLRDVVAPRVDPQARNMLMITSFNEWHEDTQIEATVGTGARTSHDDSAPGDEYTQGDSYADYGTLYLYILRQETTFLRSAELDNDCTSNFGDFSTIAERWLASPCNEGNDWCNRADIDKMGDVDMRDLLLLSMNWLRYCAIARWRLNETEGDIAYDSSGIYDGLLTGGPSWTPQARESSGALELDGIDDYVSTDFVLDPGIGPFSVFVWAKGDSPGRVLISQTDGLGFGRSWLATDASGQLMTDLRAPGRGGTALISDCLVTDGNWHEIGFVWDGSRRILMVDSAEVERDATSLPALAGATGGLYFGAAKDLDSQSFWPGFLSDIRIYGRAEVE